MEQRWGRSRGFVSHRIVSHRIPSHRNPPGSRASVECISARGWRDIGARTGVRLAACTSVSVRAWTRRPFVRSFQLSFLCPVAGGVVGERLPEPHSQPASQASQPAPLDSAVRRRPVCRRPLPQSTPHHSTTGTTFFCLSSSLTLSVGVGGWERSLVFLFFIFAAAAIAVVFALRGRGYLH